MFCGVRQVQCDLTAADRQVPGLSLGSCVFVCVCVFVCMRPALVVCANWELSGTSSRSSVVYMRTCKIIFGLSLCGSICLSDKHTHTAQQQSGPLAFLHLTWVQSAASSLIHPSPPPPQPLLACTNLKRQLHCGQWRPARLPCLAGHQKEMHTKPGSCAGISGWRDECGGSMLYRRRRLTCVEGRAMVCLLVCECVIYQDRLGSKKMNHSPSP